MMFFIVVDVGGVVLLLPLLDQGQPLVFASWETAPTLLEHDFFFTSGNDAAIRVDKSELKAGTYYVGVYNMNYDRKGTARYVLNVVVVVLVYNHLLIVAML